jgi:hypothetical protein
LQVKNHLCLEANKKKLLEHKASISHKQKCKEDSLKRRSLNSSFLALLPLAPRKSAGRGGANATFTVPRSEPRRRLGSMELAAGPPWLPETRPRFHVDPLVAIQALLFTLNIEK